MFPFVPEAPEYVVKEQSGNFQEIREHKVHFIFLKGSEKMEQTYSSQTISVQFNSINKY